MRPPNQADVDAPRRDVTGQLRYRDGSPAAGVPYELAAAGRSQRGTTDADGNYGEPAILPADTTTVTLRALDGFGLGPADMLEGMGTPTMQVTASGSGQLDTVYLLAPPKAMIVVVAPDEAGPEAKRAIAALDLLGSHGHGELLTTASPVQIAALRSHGLEVLVLDPDANHYASETAAMSNDARGRHIDERIAAARGDAADLQRP